MEEKPKRPTFRVQWPPAPPAKGPPSVGPYYVGKPGAVEYNPQKYEAGEFTYWGFGSQQLEWEEERAIEVAPVVRFKPIQLFCAVSDVDVTAIEIEGVNMLAPGAAIPVELFSEVSTFPQILWPELAPGKPIRFVVRARPKPAPRLPDLKWWRRFWSSARKAARAAKRRRFVRWLLEPEPEPRPPVFSGAFYGKQLR